MKMILIMVSSVDGKIIKWEDGDTYTWTSSEDKKHFESFVHKAKLIIMGSKTFEVAKPKAKKGVLRVVFTHHPDQYKDLIVSGQLEFTNETSKALVARLEKKGYLEALLVGGSGVNTTFFQENVVDEIWLTIEPRIFGKGKMIVEQVPMDVQLRLESVEKLNEQGTLLMKYIVVKA